MLIFGVYVADGSHTVIVFLYFAEVGVVGANLLNFVPLPGGSVHVAVFRCNCLFFGYLEFNIIKYGGFWKRNINVTKNGYRGII